MLDLVALGRRVRQPEVPAPELLEAVPRAIGRRGLGDVPADFFGVDLWHAYELSWLDAGGKPQVATARICLDAHSPNLIESKSLKLYLNSLNFSRFAAAGEVVALLSETLARVAGSQVSIALQFPEEAGPVWRPLPGRCIDALPLAAAAFTPRPELLAAAPPGEPAAEETLYSHLLRSTCPITQQPDWGSVVVRYRGPRILETSLLAYIVSFRRHTGFHETLVERIFADLVAHVRPERLTVWAQYTRRGGLDINPFRSNFETAYGHGRAFRQ